jgi:hypothetical protein
MATLHIEHAISDLETWIDAFDRFEDARKGAGVLAQRVSQPVDDDKYIVVQLDFESEAEADQFRGFLENRVWSNPDASPALEGEPRARVLRDVTPG